MVAVRSVDGLAHAKGVRTPPIEVHLATEEEVTPKVRIAWRSAQRGGHNLWLRALGAHDPAVGRMRRGAVDSFAAGFDARRQPTIEANLSKERTARRAPKREAI